MGSRKPIYFDYMATTPIDPRVIEKMIHYMGPDGDFGNPASATHLYGLAAAKAVDNARMQIAESINASPSEIVFTSGATEADNLAILGAARFYKRKGRHVITMSTEHKAVLDSFKQLEREGFDVSYLNPGEDGILDLSLLEEAIRDDTVLVSIMHVNNETGVVQDIAAIGDILSDKGIIFHVDAAQSAGKLFLNLSELSVDLMSFSAHKNYGPKGIGALYVQHRPRIRLQPQSFGGGHEGGMRSGTLATHQIVGMGEAFAIASALREKEQAELLRLRTKLWQGICHLPSIKLNGDLNRRIAGNLNFSIIDFEGHELLSELSELALSAASACSSDSNEPSYVLRAMGASTESAQRSIRLSLGRFTTENDVEYAINVINRKIANKKHL